MIETLRAFATTWVAKVLLVLVIASFAVFGVRIAVLGSYSVAEIGDDDISVLEFRRAYRRQMRLIQTSLQRQGVRETFTAEQAVAAGVPEAIAQALMRESALGQEAGRLGVEAPDDFVRRLIEEDPSFSAGAGFDARLYEQLLNSEGYRKTEFETERRRAASAAMLTAPVGLGVAAPREAGLALWRRENETRRIGFLTLTEAQIPEVEDPGDETLRAHYEAESTRFRTKERRTLDILYITPEALADPSKIEEERLKRAYDDAGARYNQPERRNLERLDFETEKAAQEAAKKARAGASLADLAAERAKLASAEAEKNGGEPVQPEDVGLGYVTKGQLAAFTPQIAEKAFADEAEGVLDPIQVGDVWALVRVAGVLPGKSVPFEEAREELAKEVAVSDAQRETPQLANDVEDARAAGATFAEIAKDRRGVTNLKVDVDIEGLDKDGAPAEGLPPDPRFLQQAFDQAEGEERDLTPGDEQTYWTSVATKVTPSALPPFEEVRSDVLEDWRRAEKIKALDERAAEAVRRIEAGEEPKAVAADLGVEYEAAEGVLRQGGGVLPQAAVRLAFSLSADAAVGRALVAPDGPRRLVLTTLEITTPDAESAEEAVDAKRAEASAELARDLQTLFEVAVEARMDGQIDRSTLRSAALEPIR